MNHDGIGYRLIVNSIFALHFMSVYKGAFFNYVFFNSLCPFFTILYTFRPFFFTFCILAPHCFLFFIVFSILIFKQKFVVRFQLLLVKKKYVLEWNKVDMVVVLVQQNSFWLIWGQQLLVWSSDCTSTKSLINSCYGWTST